MSIISLCHWIVYNTDGSHRNIGADKWRYYTGLFTIIISVGVATILFTKATPKEERMSELLFERGTMLRRIKKFGQSNKVLLEGLTYSGDPMFLNLIGRNMEDMHRCAEAEMYYRRSINRLPSRLYPYYRLGKMFAKGECRDSIKFCEVYDRALRLDIKVPSPAIDSMLSELHALNSEIFLRRFDEK